MELGFAFVAALLFLAWLTERRWLLWPAFLLSLGLGSGLSLASHQSDDRGWLPSFADWVHLSAATLWIGGLLSLGLVVWRDRELRRTAFWRFSEIAGPLVAIVVAAGVYMTYERFPARPRPLDGRLRTAAHGQARARLARARLGCVPPLRGPPAARPAGRRRARCPRSLAGEATVAISILLLAAILVDSKPPAKPAPARSAGPAEPSNTVLQARNTAQPQRFPGK